MCENLFCRCSEDLSWFFAYFWKIHCNKNQENVSPYYLKNSNYEINVKNWISNQDTALGFYIFKNIIVFMEADPRWNWILVVWIHFHLFQWLEDWYCSPFDSLHPWSSVPCHKIVPLCWKVGYGKTRVSETNTNSC